MNYSVLLCTYNGADFLDEQITSILSQSILPEEVIISDDGSSDETLNVARSTFERYAYSSYKIIEGPKSGPATNFLNGLKYNKSDYLFLSDQDDIWHQDKVDCFSKRIKLRTTRPHLLFSDSYLINSDGEIFHSSFMNYQGLNIDVLVDDSILFKNCVQGATVCINKELIDLAIKSLSIVNTKDVMMHDWWLAILANYYGNVEFIDTALVGYRQHGVNEVGAQSKTFKVLRVLLKPKLYFNNLVSMLHQASVFTKFCFHHEINATNFHFSPVKESDEGTMSLHHFSKLKLRHCGKLKKIILTGLLSLGLVRVS